MPRTFLIFAHRSDILPMQIPQCNQSEDSKPDTEARHARSKPSVRRILLLQGPVGPFFSELAREARREGYEVVRYSFNPADRIYKEGGQIKCKRSLEDWPEDFAKLLHKGCFDAVVAFGSARPGHVVARGICKEKSVPFLSLEEGYVRPGFITAEWGGNNADSPLAGRMPPEKIPGPETESSASGGFSSMALHAALYYAVRTVFSRRQERSFFHRKIRLFAEVLGWARNAAKSILHAKEDEAVCKRLMNDHAKRYFLVPLQVPTDANLRGAACGWTVRRLVDSVIASFAETAPPDTRLVFKIHPMARGHGGIAREIKSVAAGNDVSSRVDVLETGALGCLTRECAGMITINSTSGLAAIKYGRPLLVVGKSLYSTPALATCAEGRPDFDKFWMSGFVADEEIRKSFLSWISREALVSGDFYSPTARKRAVRGILNKVSVHLDVCGGSRGEK